MHPGIPLCSAASSDPVAHTLPVLIPAALVAVAAGFGSWKLGQWERLLL